MSDRKLRLKEAVVVEGRYDRMKLSGLIESLIIETGGFRVFKDKEKQHLIAEIANRRGLLILTDSDAAGFVIRNFLKGIVCADQIKNAYIPPIPGKERRKAKSSKEGVLGVEGLDIELLKEAIRKSGATILSEESKTEKTEITRMDLYEWGLWGAENSKVYREQILSSLGLPKYLSSKATAQALGCLFTKEECEEYLRKVQTEIEER